jgi:hypothetical protein
LFSIENIAKHHTVCVYREIGCPFKLNTSCSWEGVQSYLKEHAKTAHPGYIFDAPIFRNFLFEGRTVNILSRCGQLFVHYLQFQHGRLYCAVQLIGPSSEASKCKCEFTLHTTNGIERIRKTLFVTGYSGDFETIFNSGIYLGLGEAVTRNFIVDNKLKFTVTLSGV